MHVWGFMLWNVNSSRFRWGFERLYSFEESPDKKACDFQNPDPWNCMKLLLYILAPQFQSPSDLLKLIDGEVTQICEIFLLIKDDLTYKFLNLCKTSGD